MSANLIALFPTTVYVNNDQSMIPMVESWFESVEASNWMSHLRQIVLEDSAFDTTLVSHSRDHVETLVNFIDQNSNRPVLDAICNHARQFMTAQGYDKKYRPIVKAIWLNQMRSGSQHQPHAHEGTYIAGTYYTQVPAGSGALTFHSMLHDRFNIHVPDIESETVYNQTTHSIMPQAGDIILWPGHIKHSVSPCQFEGNRRGIAFNIVITE